MKKRFIISTLMVLFLGTIALAQGQPDFPSNWKWNKVLFRGNVHGVGVTPDNCIWINNYGTFNYVTSTGDTLYVVGTSIIVLNSDGTFKKYIPDLTFDGVEYSLRTDGGANSRGMSVGPNGNVYFSAQNKLYVVDYLTMEGILRIAETNMAGSASPNSITTGCADGWGNIVLSGVACAQSGVKIFSDDGSFFDMAIPVNDINLAATSRDISLSPDGCDLVIASTAASGETGVAVSHWHSDDGTYGTYTFVQELGDYGGIGQAVHIDKNLSEAGRVWIGMDGNPTRASRYDRWDLSENPPEIVDYIVSPVAITQPTPGGIDPTNEFNLQGAFGMPRGFWLSNDGKKAYVTHFEAGVLEYEYTGTGQNDAKEPQAVPEGFALSQNYPNPFNPSTNFTYSLPNKADVRIAIYDLFGREINTLVNESKDAGTYTISWNGRDNYNRQVATGVYFYRMQAAGFEKAMKMMLVK
jgi:hypothetical protein